MSRLYLFNFNNYGNRIVKGRGYTLNDYKTADSGYRMYGGDTYDINFYRGDGVNTTQTINFGTAESEKDADYLIVTALVNNTETIISRWFIIECNYNRKNQMILTLRRDLVIDFWNDIYRTDCEFFCEKGAVSASDNFIFNGENVTFNRKKTAGMVVGGAGYLVGYLDKGFSSTRAYYYRPSVNIVESLSDIPIYRYSAMGGGYLISKMFLQYSLLMGNTTVANAGSDLQPGFMATINYNYNIPTIQSITDRFYMGRSGLTSSNVSTFFSNKLTAINASLRDYVYESRPDFASYLDYSSEAGKIYYVESLNTFYQVNISTEAQGSTFTGNMDIDSDRERAIFYTPFSQQFNDGWYAQPYGYGNVSRNFSYQVVARKVTFTQSTTNSFTIPSFADRKHTNKPYDIFVAQYSATNLEVISRVASALSGSGALIDIQRVPYMGSNWNVSGHYYDWTVSFAAAGNTPAMSTTFKFIDFDEFSGQMQPIAETTPPTSYVGYTEKSNIADIKLDALSLTYRLISPNHANAWDFSPAQNRGCNANFNYECTLKPYQPYVHVWPTFNETGLYGAGNQYDDRGIVCMGSFSLATSSDAWQTYQINNASYQNAFDRQIENLNVTQDAQRTLEKWQIAAGTVGAITSGAVAGSSVGGAVGAAVGGVVAGATSLATGIADYQINEKLRNEAIDYTKDQFGYSMQNIKARPFTFSQSSSFDINNSVGILVDIYVPTDDEKSAFKDKIKWNGMTVMKLGNFKSFWDVLNTNKDYVRYIKGKLVRCPHLNDDTHVFNEIANELYKGVYIN